jgi:hypothetical protein
MSQLGHSRLGRDSSQPGHVRYAAESGSELSYRYATGTNTMTATVSIDRPPIAKAAVPRRRSRKPATVSASALALHLDCSRTYIGRLEAEGVIERRDDGRFDQDQCRAKYISHLKEERKRSPRSEADTAFTAAKAELIRIRIQEKQRVLILAEEAYAQIDQMCGLFLTGLSGFAARCGARDMTTRRMIDKAVFDLRTEISEAATALADKDGEPPLDDAA